MLQNQRLFGATRIEYVDGGSLPESWTPHGAMLMTAWRKWRGGRTVPLRSEVVLADIAPAVPYLLLLRREGDDYVYRIVGEEIRSFWGFPLMRRTMTELWGRETAASIKDYCDRLLAGPAIGWHINGGDADGLEARNHVQSRLMLPLADDGARRSYILCLTEFHTRPEPPAGGERQGVRLGARYVICPLPPD